jgi:hypothetical protein
MTRYTKTRKAIESLRDSSYHSRVSIGEDDLGKRYSVYDVNTPNTEDAAPAGEDVIISPEDKKAPPLISYSPTPGIDDDSISIHKEPEYKGAFKVLSQKGTIRIKDYNETNP